LPNGIEKFFLKFIFILGSTYPALIAIERLKGRGIKPQKAYALYKTTPTINYAIFRRGSLTKIARDY